MEGHDEIRNRKSMLWGAFFIALGVAFLIERFGIVDLPVAGRLWPLVFFVIAASHVFERRPGAAIGMLLMGTVFLAVTFDWMGLTWFNFWPLLLVAMGVSMVVKALTGEDRQRRHGGTS